ncbi:MAG: hypothetical protein ABI748_13135 [Dokdonella sp.]
MKRITLFGSAVAIGLASATAMANGGATAAFNEAVRTVNGKRVVEVAPFPAHMKHTIGVIKKPVEYPNEVAVVSIETNDGLVDCYGTLWYHPTACNPSDFGRAVRYRTWIVLMGGKWFACASHLSAKSCTPIIVDGKLRPIPGSEE